MDDIQILGAQVIERGEWDALVEVEVDVAGVAGAVTVIAGVRGADRGTAEAARTTVGLEAAWLPAAGPTWPESFVLAGLPYPGDDADEWRWAIEHAAIEAWAEEWARPRRVPTGGQGGGG